MISDIALRRHLCAEILIIVECELKRVVKSLVPDVGIKHTVIGLRNSRIHFDRFLISAQRVFIVSGLLCPITRLEQVKVFFAVLR